MYICEKEKVSSFYSTSVGITLILDFCFGQCWWWIYNWIYIIFLGRKLDIHLCNRVSFHWTQYSCMYPRNGWPTGLVKKVTAQAKHPGIESKLWSLNVLRSLTLEPKKKSLTKKQCTEVWREVLLLFLIPCTVNMAWLAETN